MFGAYHYPSRQKLRFLLSNLITRLVSEQFAKVLLLSKHFFQLDNQPWQKRRRHFLFGSEPLDWILAIQLESEPREFTRHGIDDPEFVHSEPGISSLLVFQINGFGKISILFDRQRRGIRSHDHGSKSIPFICLNPSLSPVPEIRPLLSRKQQVKVNEIVTDEFALEDCGVTSGRPWPRCTPLEILVLFCTANRPLLGIGSGQLNP
jgi:hypothetical protein